MQVSERMPRRTRGINAIDELIDRRVVKSEERLYDTLHETQLAKLYAPFFEDELAERLVKGTVKRATDASVSFYACCQKVDTCVESSEFEDSVRVRNSLREHRRALEAYDRWIVVSEPHAMERANEIELADNQTIVLSSEVAGSHALRRADRIVEVVCAECDDIIPIEDAQLCACSMLVARRGRIAAAARRWEHECATREGVARMVCTKLILCLPQFPFTVLVNERSQKVVAPIGISTGCEQFIRTMQTCTILYRPAHNCPFLDNNSRMQTSTKLPHTHTRAAQPTLKTAAQQPDTPVRRQSRKTTYGTAPPANAKDSSAAARHPSSGTNPERR